MLPSEDAGLTNLPGFHITGKGVRRSKSEALMSALGHKRTSEGIGDMSALPPKAAIETGPVISFDNSGSFAMLTAIRRASDSKVICAII